MIAIISVLAAFLLPTVQNAMAQARLMACKTNLRAQYLGHAQYWIDNRDACVMPAYGTVPATWVYFSAAYSKSPNSPVNLGVLFQQRYLDGVQQAYCPDSTATAALQGDLRRLQEIADTGTVSTAGNYQCSYVTQAPNGDAGGYAWRKHSRIFDWHYSTGTVQGNMPGEELYYSIAPLSSTSPRRFLRSPRYLAYCALPREWHAPWNVPTFSTHGREAFNMLWFDGVLSSVHTLPDDPAYWLPSGHWYYRDTLLNQQYPDYVAP